MIDTSFEDLAGRLTTDALDLIQEMVDAHLDSSGDRMFIPSDTISGTLMLFRGQGSSRAFKDFDGTAVEDLLHWRLLHPGSDSRGTPYYRVSGEAIRFCRWFRAQQGTAITQVETEVRRTVDGDAFGAAHPGSAHHLAEALQLLWSGRTDQPVVSEIGDHLRKALMDVTTDIVGADAAGQQEKPIERLTAHLQGLRLPDRDTAVLLQLVGLARVVLGLDHRLNHVRDERDKGAPDVSWEETRRASFLTSLVCYELHRLSN